MQRFVLVSLVAVAAAAPLAAPTVWLGQGASSATAPTKIAFINSQDILKSTPGYAVAESTYRRELQASQNEYQKLQQQLDSAVQVFDHQSIALSPAARQAEQKDLPAMQQPVEPPSTPLQDHVRQRGSGLVRPLRTRIT